MNTSRPDQEALIREAAKLVIRLNEDPVNAQALKDRDVFLARGEAEREAFAKTVRTVKIGARRSPPNTSVIAAFMLLAASAFYFGYEPLRVAMLADWRTKSSTAEIRLSSGDVAHLDASSAIIDKTDGAVRRVGVLHGGGFFDVDISVQPFEVDAGPLTAAALGTAFEVSSPLSLGH